MADQLFRRNQALSRKNAERLRNERSRILIVCEDSKSSPAYFESVCRHYRVGKIKVTGESGSSPTSVIDFAIKNCEDNNNDYDTVYCVIDRDDHKDFERAISRAKQWVLERKKKSKLKVIASYPCFEIWIYLHFLYTSRNYPSYDDLIPDLNSILVQNGYPKYSKQSNYPYHRFLQKLDCAINNADKLETEQKNNNALNPSTHIHYLVRDLEHFSQNKFV